MNTIPGNNHGRIPPVWMEWIAFCAIVMGMAIAIAVLLGGAAILLASLPEGAETASSAAAPRTIEVGSIVSTPASATSPAAQR